MQSSMSLLPEVVFTRTTDDIALVIMEFYGVQSFIS